MRKLQRIISLIIVPLTKISWTMSLLGAAALVICVSGSVQAQEEEVIRFDVSLVTVSVAVKDHKGRALLGLKPENFRVTDENTPVSPEFFDSEGPASIVFVLDTSSSMQGSRWKNLLNGLKDFVKKSRAGNDYTLITFDSRAHLLLDSASPAELWNCLTALRPNGDTALYDGVLLGLEALKGTRQRNKALVLISDGMDNSSRTKLAEVEKEALSRRAAIFSVGMLLNEQCRIRLQEACIGKEVIKQLADVTGGLSFFPEAWGLSRVLTEISNEVNTQYSLSYYPPDKHSGWRNVRVTVAQTERQPKLRYQQRYLRK